MRVDLLFERVEARWQVETKVEVFIQNLGREYVPLPETRRPVIESSAM